MATPDVLTGPIVTSSERPCDLYNCTKAQLLDYFENTYGLDEWLFSSLKSEECFYKCPDRLRLPLLFYYCHPAVVYVNKLMLANLIQERVNKSFEAMFETGVDEMSWDDTENYRMGGAYKWPSVSEVVDYRRKVRDLVRSVIRDTELTLPVTHDSPWWSVWMSIEHERIHLETSSVLIRQLPISMVSRPIGWKYAPLSSSEPVLKNPMIKQDGAEVHLGKEHDWPVWGWDNEYGHSTFEVPDFEASQYLVTNRQMLEFVKNGGYDKKKYWSREGWEWKEFRQARSNCGADLATHSHCRNHTKNGELIENGFTNGYGDHCFKLRLMFDLVSLPLDWPVEVNYHEAKAFCSWMGDDYRLPTEAEEQLLRGLPEFDPKEIVTDPIYAANVTKIYNMNLAYGSPSPVNFYPKSTRGCCDTLGNVWKWVEDHFNGFQGFKTNMYYDDFSTPFFDGKHTVFIGGSWISTGVGASRFYRVGFRRHFMQHAGFRLARTLDTSKYMPSAAVETPVFTLDTKTLYCPKDEPATIVKPAYQQTLNTQYIYDCADEVAKMATEQYHCDNCTSGMTAIIKRIRNLVSEATQDAHASRVLLVGCGTGRLGFELSAVCDHVIGCDTSARCVHVACEVKNKGEFHFNSEPEIFGKHHGIDTVYLPEDARPERVQFKQLTWIPFELQDFHIVINTMLDRSQNPRAWLLRMRELVTSGENGRAIVVSKKWTPKQLKADFEPALQLVLEEQIPSSDEEAYVLSMWKRA